MKIESNTATTNQVPAASNVGTSNQASAQSEDTQQQSSLSEDSIVSMLKQDGVVVNFSLDKNTNDFVVKVINPFTNEVIREVPPEEIPGLAANIQQAGGMLIDKHA